MLIRCGECEFWVRRFDGPGMDDPGLCHHGPPGRDGYAPVERDAVGCGYGVSIDEVEQEPPPPSLKSVLEPVPWVVTTQHICPDCDAVKENTGDRHAENCHWWGHHDG